MKVHEKLEKELKGAPKKFIAQIECTAENYKEIADTSIKFLLENKKARGIYVTFNKPVFVLMDFLQSKGIETDRLFFIDGISGATQNQLTGKNNFAVLSGPTALTELSIEITRAKETGQYEFILFDALSTILIYNSQKRTIQFTYFLMTKLRDYNFSGVVLFIKSELEKEVFDSVAHLTDLQLKF